MIDVSYIPEKSESDIKEIIEKDLTYEHYNRVKNRALKMSAWFNAEEHRDIHSLSGKSLVFPRSQVESDEEYQARLKRMDIFPIEMKFFSTQQRIYDENNVDRTYPEGDFWDWKKAHYDDTGTDIDGYYRDKVMYVKEIEGMGASIVDIAMDAEGNTITIDGKPLPYPFLIGASELYYFEHWQGHLSILVTRTKQGDKEVKTVYTPKRIRKYIDKKLTLDIDNPFEEVPATLLIGKPDPFTSFKTGMPRRYHLTGLYLALCELFYDLKKGTQLFAYPIMAYGEEMIKAVAGVLDSDNKLDASKVKQKLGRIAVIPDGTEAPKDLFYQAEMSGLEHLAKIIFTDLINIIYQFGQVRDKSKVVHNASGRSKQFDSVEEQGLLAQTALEMERIEENDARLMAKVRDEEFDKFTIKYSKHHDLRSADEIWQHISEGFQYGGLNTTTYSYLIGEYLRKTSAPKETQEKAKEEVDTFGKPMKAEDITALKDLIDRDLLILKARPELLSEKTREEVVNALKGIRESLALTETNNQE